MPNVDRDSYFELPRCFYDNAWMKMLTDATTCIFWALHTIATASALNLVMLDVPSPVTVGESVELTCIYELQNEQLYSIKWYKNEVEFYRFVPSDWPPGQFLPLPGIQVDLSKSGPKHVYLKYIDLNTAGVYRCEVSAEALSFQTAETEKEMKAYVLPSSGPVITGGKYEYGIGDTILLNCTSAKSKPAATLRWFINEEMAEESEYEIHYSTTLHANGLETSKLFLRFVVTEDHFRKGTLQLKCMASISSVYAMSNEQHSYIAANQRKPQQRAPADFLQVREVRGDAQKIKSSQGVISSDAPLLGTKHFSHPGAWKDAVQSAYASR